MLGAAISPLARFDDYIQNRRYSRHSFVNHLVTGQVDRPRLRRWAIQKYHQTYLQNRAFSAIHANSVEEDIRQFMVDQLIDEETPLRSGPDAHYNLIRRLALAIGAAESEVRSTPVAPPVAQFVDYLVGLCRREDPVFAMLAIYVNESQTPESARKMADALRGQFGLGDEALAWFTVHGEADEEHAHRSRQLIVKHGRRYPDFEDRGMRIVERGCREWMALQDFYYSVIA